MPNSVAGRNEMIWKRNKQSVSAGDDATILQAGRDINIFGADFPTEIVDQKINEELSRLLKSRFFVEFDRVGSLCVFGRRLVDGDLSKGTDKVRGPALAWCARLLSRTEELCKAEEFLAIAKNIIVSQETLLAEAFVCSQKGEKEKSLKLLAGIKSPVARSAALMVVAHHEGGESALQWLQKAGFDFSDLSCDGKVIFLMHQLELDQLEAAKESLDKINDQDLAGAPILHHLLGMTHLLSAVPTDLRAIVLRQMPFEAAGFPLFSDLPAMESRRAAHKHFMEAAAAAQQLNCHDTAMIDDEYALWLELKDPEYSEEGMQRLRTKLRDPKLMLRLVPLGLQFGVKLDLAAVQHEIDQQIALNGGITPEAAIARFSLAFTQKTPGDVANYIDQYFDELSDFLDKKVMRFLQIESLSRAGFPSKAKECLGLLMAEGLSVAEESRAKAIIAEAEGADPVETRKAQFELTGNLTDLLSLVEELDTKNILEELCKYSEILFLRTRSVTSAERYANALSNSRKHDQLVNFLEEHSDLRTQSKNLQMFYSWGLFHEGKFAESRAELSKLSSDRDDQNYRALEMNLGIAVGDWATLTAIVANEYKDREKRSAQELIRSAQLAIHLNSPHSKDLIFAAAEKGCDDATILASAYFMATSAGLDDDPETAKWLQRAAELSGEDGPIQRMSLQDILDRKPDWERRESETWHSLSRGELPMFLAAQSLNKSLVDFTLFPSLANLAEPDPRRKSLVPAFSGNRRPVKFDYSDKTIGLEVTALLTLSFLGLLDKALAAFDTVYLTHSTLSWLFEEKQKATYHQPSRISNAHHLRDLLAREVIGEFAPSTMLDSDLAQEVGDGLASLILEAKNVFEDDDTQRLVVRPYPVHRISTFLEEVADLQDYSAVMSSCLSVVEKLREKGQITAQEEQKARAYLKLQERPWPDQPEISDGAILYLDDLAVTYFQHLGLLEKLHMGGFRIVVSSGEVAESRAFITYERIADKVNDSIDKIRAAVNQGIETGKVRFGKQESESDSESLAASEHPTVAAFRLALTCDALVSDERFLNQFTHFDDGNIRADIFSTLDLLDAFAGNGTISTEELLEYRTTLRRAGFIFVPVDEAELSHCLSCSTVKNEIIYETSELKAIRENILRVRMSDWLQLPKEAPWLDSTLKAFIKVLRAMWVEGADIADVTIRSNWIVDQVDVRGWAHSIIEENRDNFINVGRGAHLLLFLSPLTEAPGDVKDSYWNWVEENILQPVKEQFPELYKWIVSYHEEQMDQIIEAKLAET